MARGTHAQGPGNARFSTLTRQVRVPRRSFFYFSFYEGVSQLLSASGQGANPLAVIAGGGMAGAFPLGLPLRVVAAMVTDLRCHDNPIATRQVLPTGLLPFRLTQSSPASKRSRLARSPAWRTVLGTCTPSRCHAARFAHHRCATL